MYLNNKNSVDQEIRSVLVIDDSPTDLALLKAHLSSINLEVLLANESQMGIDIAIKEQPDLILLDVMMPGIDGFETCRILKSGNSSTS